MVTIKTPGGVKMILTPRTPEEEEELKETLGRMGRTGPTGGALPGTRPIARPEVLTGGDTEED